MKGSKKDYQDPSAADAELGQEPQPRRPGFFRRVLRTLMRIDRPTGSAVKPQAGRFSALKSLFLPNGSGTKEAARPTIRQERTRDTARPS